MVVSDFSRILLATRLSQHACSSFVMRIASDVLAQVVANESEIKKP